LAWSALLAVSVGGLAALAVAPVSAGKFVIGVVICVGVGVQSLALIHAELRPESNLWAEARERAKERHPVNRRYRSRRGFDGDQLAERVETAREFAAIVGPELGWGDGKVRELEALYLVPEVAP
jgi:hypothetical protein